MRAAAVPDREREAGPTPASGSRIARNIFALASGQAITWTMTLAWTLIVPRILGPGGIGVIVTAQAVTGILAIALGFGTRNYLVRAIVVSRREAAGLMATATVLRLALVPVFAAVTIAYAHFAHYGGEGTVVLYIAAGATVLTLVAEPMQAAFQAIERMEYLAYSDVINKSVQALLGAALVLAGMGVLGFAWCWMATSGAVLALDVMWLRRYVRLELRTSLRRLREMARQSLAYWAFGMFFMIYLWIDTAMLSLMTGPTVVGWYGVPTRLFQTMMFIPVLLSTAWLPRLVAVFERDPRELPVAARAPVELVLGLGLLVAGAIAVAANPVIRLVYGSAYGHAVPVMILLGLCIPPMYLNIMVSQVLIAARRQTAWTWVMLAATVINPALNAALIPITQRRLGNGAIGASISLLITELVIAIIGLLLAGRGIVGRRQLRRLRTVGACSAAMYGAALAAHGLGAVPSLGAGAGALVASAFALRMLTPQEVALVRRWIAGTAARLPGPLARLAAPAGPREAHVAAATAEPRAAGCDVPRASIGGVRPLSMQALAAAEPEPQPPVG